MINLFGEHGGFDKFRDRILRGDGLNVSVIAAMIRWVSIRITKLCLTIYLMITFRPFGLCADFLSTMCVEKYIVPVVVSNLYLFFLILFQTVSTL